ncbi:hypothetical protein Vi05172_g431 [Venturia inaequalis]|nr:hypothetical protein Vi05172_g431 [Venturia inaequalis]
MNMFCLFTAALVTVVALVTANPLPTALETRSARSEMEVSYGYWEPSPDSVGDPSWISGSQSIFLRNGVCECIPSIPHMNHITSLTIEDNEYCVFYSKDRCDDGGNPSNTTFKTGSTESLVGDLKFEPRSVNCSSPGQSGSVTGSIGDGQSGAGVRRSLTGSTHLPWSLPVVEPRNVENEAVERSLAIRDNAPPHMKVRFCLKGALPQSAINCNWVYDLVPNACTSSNGQMWVKNITSVVNVDIFNTWYVSVDLITLAIGTNNVS